MASSKKKTPKKKASKKTAKAVNNSKPRRRVPGEKRRMNLKMDEELADWAFKFAERRKTTVTQLVTDFFMSLREQEEEHLAQDAPQV